MTGRKIALKGFRIKGGKVERGQRRLPASARMKRRGDSKRVRSARRTIRT